VDTRSSIGGDTPRPRSSPLNELVLTSVTPKVTARCARPSAPTLSYPAATADSPPRDSRQAERLECTDVSLEPHHLEAKTLGKIRGTLAWCVSNRQQRLLRAIDRYRHARHVATYRRMKHSLIAREFPSLPANSLDVAQQFRDSGYSLHAQLHDAPRHVTQDRALGRGCRAPAHRRLLDRVGLPKVGI